MKQLNPTSENVLAVINELLKYSKVHGQDADVVELINILSSYDVNKAYEKAVILSNLWLNIANRLKKIKMNNMETKKVCSNNLSPTVDLDEEEYNIGYNNSFDSFDTYGGFKEREG